MRFFILLIIRFIANYDIRKKEEKAMEPGLWC